jgi:hypothetical protein
MNEKALVTFGVVALVLGWLCLVLVAVLALAS